MLLELCITSTVRVQPCHVLKLNCLSDHRGCNVQQKQKIAVWTHAVNKKRTIVLLV